jgi:raffinose/stachyose/melibiose transport system permease protein
MIRTSDRTSIARRLYYGRVGYAFVLPGLVIYVLFFVWPFVSAILLSLVSWNGAAPEKVFVGLDNFAQILSDPIAELALTHNIVWIVVATTLSVSAALLLAILVSRLRRLQSLVAAIFFLPVLLSPAVIGIIWAWIYHPTGPLNDILRAVGLGSLARGWLGDPDMALYAVIFVASWGNVGFLFVILLAALRNVDQSLLDAAHVDGANAWQRFRSVTIPQIRRVLTTVVVVTLIAGFAAFDIVYVMTGGGPAQSTELIATYSYQQAFFRSHVGYGTAVSLLMTALALITVLAYLRVGDRTE